MAGKDTPTKRTAARRTARRDAAKGTDTPASAATPTIVGEAPLDEKPGTLRCVMASTNGGGSPENVPGFDIFRAVTAGFQTRRIAGPTMLDSRPDGGTFSQGRPSPGPYGGRTSWRAKPEAVIGVDSRVMVDQTSMTPWRCICHLEIEFESGPTGFGTGFLVSPNTVMTAAHVLVDRVRDGWKSPRKAKLIRVIPGRNGSLAPYGYFVCEFRDGQAFVPGAWTDPAASEADAARQDFAMLRIPDEARAMSLPVGERLGYFGVKAFKSGISLEKIRMLFINNAGYPYEADKPYGTLWYNAGRVGDIRDDMYMNYLVDTEQGQSGSPIYFFDEEKNQRYVVAIHTTGDFTNRGLLISKEIFDQICDFAGRRPEDDGV